MKSSRPIPSDLSSNRRAQPVRQARQNPPRSSGSLLRSFSGREVSGGGLGIGPGQREQIEIYPAIEAFTDAITALPKELVRHFTLLKEVDAKIFAPEEALGQLVQQALNAPLPERRQPQTQLQLGAPTSVHTSGPSSVNGSIVNGQNGSIANNTDATDMVPSVYDSENIPRRHLFRQCVLTMSDMLISLDEKNHVISTATEALNKQLMRLDEVFPFVESEISEEARYGSSTHWAYPENRANKPSDRAGRVAAANQVLREIQAHADEAAARSDARKQAMLAKKGRNNTVESDFDEHHEKSREKKPHGNTKKGRPADATSVGLGITNGGASNGNPAAKRRKVEKGPIGGTGMERSLSSVFGVNGTAAKSGKGISPRETPVPDPSKKKKAAATNSAQPRKRTVHANAMSPSMASSPIVGTFAEAKSGRISPGPGNVGRPSIGRARQNSTQSAVDNSRQRPASSASNKPNGANGGTADLNVVAGATGRSISEIKATMKESANNAKGEHMIEDIEQDGPEVRGGLVVGARKDSTLKREDSEANGDSMQGLQATSAQSITTTKSGRASKPSTPAVPSFPDPPRSRSARNALEQTTTNKRSHKKGAGQAAQLIAAQTVEDDNVESLQDEEEDAEIDADEPRYCYCNGVSYGEMVACDYDRCAKEWFHLDCVGLKVAPQGKAKWYCDDCKEIMKSSKRFTGR